MKIPTIRLSDAARRAIQDAAVEAGGDPLRITISDRFEYDLRFDARTRHRKARDSRSTIRTSRRGFGNCPRPS